MEIYFGNHFVRNAKRLPEVQKRRLAQLLTLLARNPYDSKLHTKHLTGKLSGIYSFRVGRDYRVLFQFLSPTEIQLVDVAHRKDIYR